MDDSKLEAGISLLRRGQLAAAERHFQALVAERPEAAAWHCLGAAQHSLGQFVQAAASFIEAIALDPKAIDARCALAAAFMDAGRHAEAEAELRRALDIDSGHAQSHHNLAVLLFARGARAQALEHYDRALLADPAHAGARINRAELRLALGDAPGALEDYAHLETQGGDYSREVREGRLRAFLLLHRDEDALALAGEILRLDAGNARTWLLRGIAAASLARLSEAQAAFERARELTKDQKQTFSLPRTARAVYVQRALERQTVCDWRDRAQLVATVRAMLADKDADGLADPALIFNAVALPLGSGELKAIAVHVAAGVSAAVARRVRPPSAAGARMRIGFLSPDFRDHPMHTLARGLFRRLDRERFEIHAYALNPDEGDVQRADLKGAADRFVDVSGWQDDAVASRIAADGIDVLIECGGYCQGTRPGILACRPAAVRASYLGMPATMGASFVDYRISDAFCTPPEEQTHWSERLLLLPETHLVYDPPQASSEAPGRASLELPEKGFVFCCMSNPMKIEPMAFAAWMEILRAVPRGVLWLHATGGTARENLRRAAQAAGIDPSRLIFASRTPRAEFVACIGRADLFLDTFHFSAHTTALDALWGGVPILACPGETMPSRLAASLLHAARIPELVAADAKSYVETAVALSQAPQRMAALRERVAQARTGAPIFDAPSRVRAFERALIAMLERQRAGLAPEMRIIE